MGLFGDNEDKREQMTQAMMMQYGLEDLSDPIDKQSVQNIAESNQKRVQETEKFSPYL